MSKSGYIFYFDESFHTRVITNKSIKADNYYNSYTSIGIGIKKSLKNKGLRKLRLLEKKYKKLYSVEELKSEVVSRKKYINGLASFSKIDLEFYYDFFELLYTNEFIYYISSCDKVEYLLLQCDYKKSYYMNKYAMIYTLVKAINTYKPQKVMNDIFSKSQDLLCDLKKFFREQIKTNGNLKLKEKENIAFSQVLLFLDSIKTTYIKYDFEYHFTYYGLKNLLDELNSNLKETKVIIDEEGRGKILQNAKEIGFKNSIQLNSKKCIGIRSADILCGFISRFMQGIYISTYNNPKEKYDKKHYIPVEWFKINENQFKLYKMVAKYLKKYSEIYYCSYISLYSDLFIETIGIIYYFDEFKTFKDYLSIELNDHYEKCNTIIVARLMEHLNQVEKMYCF